MNRKFNRNLQLGFGISLLILIVIGVVSFRTMNALLESDGAVAHSNLVMQKLEKALSLMKDAETGQRGYLLTGQKQFLDPYNGALQHANQLVDEVADLTSEQPIQQKNAADIKQVMEQRMFYLEAMIKKKDAGQPIAYSELVAGKKAMDALRSAVDRAEGKEQQLLKDHADRLMLYRKVTPVFIITALLLGISITLASYLKVISGIGTKNRLYEELKVKEEETAAFNEKLTAINEELGLARRELSEVNASLEIRVADRTRELAESEEKTQALNEELTAVNEELAATNEEMMATNEELSQSQIQLRELVNELTVAEERSAKLAAIVDSSDDAIVGKTTEGIVTSWNGGAERIFGYTERDMVGQSILKIIPEDRQHEEPVILSKLKNGERIEHYETIRQTQDRRLINVSLTMSPIRNKQGVITGISKIARDITEQKRDEQRKNDFIGMASHELKTPLTSLTALIQVLMQKLAKSEDQFVTSALDKANQQTRRMASLINGFLNVSRLEAGKLIIEPQPVDLNKMIEDGLDEIRLTAASHNFVFESAGALTVMADKEKIGSVISNLLSNAVKYSPRGKKVTVETTIWDGKALVGVHDEGMGIKPQDIDKLFERYYRVQSEHTKQISGFGVGLYLSAEIVERHGGKIWAESDKGTGSTFYFTLPLA